MTEQEFHQVAMCAAHTFADMMVRMAIEDFQTQSSAAFGKAVAEAYAAARAELSPAPEKRQAEVLRAPDATCAACVAAAAEEHRRHCKANGSGG